jgi:hypothetical protein
MNMKNEKIYEIDINVPRVVDAYNNYNRDSQVDACQFGFTSQSENSPYALCFALFGFNLIKDTNSLFDHVDERCDMMMSNLNDLKVKTIEKGEDLRIYKPYLQLLTFTLSCFSLLGRIRDPRIETAVVELIPDDITVYLDRIRCFEGVAGSGNLAMFMAVLLIHARDYIGMNTQDRIDTWCSLHLEKMNRFGFWGDVNSMTHLQFQNGYHQYEIFDYLELENKRASVAADSVASLADSDGHFAPYPGGGGCYDYDAVFLLTNTVPGVGEKHRPLLMKTARTICSEQNTDGGFCESLRIRPRSLSNMLRIIRHILDSSGEARIERIKYGLTLQRPKHDRIHTHWSRYSRRWDESDLWDSWFRMMTLARIDVALNPSKSNNWGFIDYPGIGFHSCLRKQ